MKRRFLSVILCLAMIIGTLPMNIMADRAADIQTYADLGLSPIGEGTEENPYLITSAGELKWFGDKVNGGDNSISARLMSDIRIDNADGWTAIGSSANPYNGTFDGNNYSIDTASGKMWTMASDDKSILFGYIGGSGVIKSLNMKWVQVIAVDNAAVIAYENNGTVEQCSIKTILNNTEATESFCGFAYTNNGTIKNCLSILREQYKNTCGFVHTNNGTIESSLCSFEGTGSDMNEETDSVYAIAKESAGTITNCYCTCTYRSGIVKDTGNVQKVYSNGDGINDDSKKAALLKEIAWLLNNNGSTEGDSTDPWRYGEDVSGANHYTPTLDPTDQKVLSGDGVQTEIPHTHRVDGIIREFTRGDIRYGNTFGEYVYFDDDDFLFDEFRVEVNMTVCLNGNDLDIHCDSIVVPSGISFTVTDCQETAGTVASGGNAGVTVDGGTFVLDNASISGCAVGIDYKSGTVKLSGKARVKDNTTNIKLAENQKLSFGILDKSAHFGVTYDGDIDVGGEVEITDRTGAAYAQHLSSDNDEYLIADGSNAVVLKNPEAHSHCICGAEHKEISGTDENGTTTGHTTEESVVFKPWNPNSHRDSENRPTLPTNEGSYYLTENADLKDGAEDNRKLVSGGLHVGSFGDAELSDITIKKDEKDTVLDDDDGVILDNNNESGGIVRFLKSGYAYKNEDGSFIYLSDNPTSIPIGTTVTVAECTKHEFKSGKCKYCGYVCKHENVDEDTRECGTCGATMAARVWMNPDKPFSETPIYVWYLTPEEAFASIKPEDGQRQVAYYDDQTLTEDVEISGNVICYSNGKRLDFSNGKSFVVKDGGRLQLAGGGYTGAVTVKSGGDLVVAQKPENSVGTLTVYDGSESNLLYSHFEKITIADGEKTIADMLPTTRTLRYDNNSWASDTELSAKGIRNVTVVKKPFYGESIEADKVSLDFNGADTKAKLTAKITEDETNRNAAAYKWYSVKGNDETEVQSGDNNKLEISFSATGEYTYKCEITKDGYTRTVTKTITVNKGTPTYKPTQNDLVYNGKDQSLISGTLGTGQKIWYRLGDDGEWSENIPKATDAGKYTVYYKVDENDNYNGIAETNVEATIKKQVLKGIKTEHIAKQYDGTLGLPTNFSISKFTCVDDTEINPPDDISWEGSYTSQAAGENNNVTITVNLGKAAKNYVFDDGTAKKVFTLSGTIEKAKAPQQKDGEFTIVKDLERVYTYDLSTLLGDVSNDKPYGKITYGEPHVDIVGYYNENEGKATIDDKGILTLPIQESYGGAGGSEAGTVTVKVTTENYNDYNGNSEITLTVNVKAMYKILLDLRGKPTLNPEKITYGQKLSDIALSGSLEDYDGNTVKGTFSWKNPDTMPPAGNASGEWIFTPDDEFYMYEAGNGTASFTVEPKDIAGASAAIGDFSLEYNGNAQTPAAKVTIGGEVITGVWSEVTNVSDKTSFTANGNFKGTIENVETGMKTKDISSAVITLADSPEYNGSEQTQGIERITVDGLTLSEGDYDISDNKAADVKVDGNYVLTITGKGNFNGTKNAEWNIMPTEPTESADKKTTARVRRGRTLSDADVTYGELLGVDGTTVLDGAFLWNDGTKVINEDGTEQMTFTPTSKNYLPMTINVAVSAYTADGGSSSSSSSSATVYTVKFNTNGGSDIENQTVKKNAKVSEPSAPAKDGYKFDGWFTDKNLKNKYNFASKVTESFTLYAAWSEVKNDTDSNPTDKPENPEKGDSEKGNSEKENPFDDVKKDAWYYDDVINAVAKGLFNGTENKTFAPDDIITRAMFVTVLYHAEGEPKVNAAAPFADVEADGYYANAVIWATQNGIVNGVSETEFAPNENITREQIAAIMFRYAKYKGYDVTQGGMQICEFSDYESISEYAMPAMAWAVNTGLMKGKTDTALKIRTTAQHAPK